MRLSRLPVTLASLVTTALVAAVAGVASVAWTPETELPEVAIASASSGVEADVVVEADPASWETELQDDSIDASLSMEIQPVRASVEGEDVVLEARLRNTGTTPQVIDDAGVLDLAVQRTASPLPMGLGEVTFLALCEVADPHASVLQPGETVLRTLTLGWAPPFDAPGRYLVAGHWRGAAGTAVVRPFELVIGARSGLACSGCPRVRRGA